jgi:tight adherence protein B
MLYLATLMTFLSVALGLAGLIHLRRSRTADLSEAGTSGGAAYRAPSLLERLEREARQAGLPWTRRFFLVAWAAGTGLGLLYWLAGDPLVALLFPGLAIGAPRLLIRYRARARAEAFSQQLPAALTLMANVIRAGGSLYHAVSAAARQMPEPIRSELARVERAIQLQIPPAEALAHVRDRIGLPEFSSVVIACKVAGEAGADLDRVLESIARELVEDRQFLKAMQGASAEGRMSARVVTAIPFVILGGIALLNPAYLRSALGDGDVLVLFAIAGVLMAAGWLVIQRITDVRTW